MKDNFVLNVDDFKPASDKIAHQMYTALDEYVKKELKKIDKIYRSYDYTIAESFNFDDFLRDCRGYIGIGYEPFGRGLKIEIGETLTGYFIICVDGHKEM